MKVKVFCWVLIVFCFGQTSTAQVRVESFWGDEEPVTDVFWIKPFAVDHPLIYLSRNKFTLVNYEDERVNFSTLNILSYQLGKTGIAPALAATATSVGGFQGRAGLQFLKVKPRQLILYFITSTKLGDEGDVRPLMILQVTPKLKGVWRLFQRIEWVSSIRYEDGHNFSQGIIKSGLTVKTWEFGVGAELFWVDQKFNATQQNLGIFLARNF